MSKMSAGRHLAFSEIECVIVRSTIPENPTLEPEIAPVGQPDVKYWPF